MPMINKLHPALNWRKGTIQPGCFGSSWKGCVLELLLNTWQCTPLLQVLLSVGTSGTATPSPPAWIHVELPAEALSPSCASMESQCGRCWCAAVQYVCCLRELYPAFISCITSGIIQLDPCLVETSVWTWGKGLKINSSEVFWWEECHRQKRENTADT